MVTKKKKNPFKDKVRRNTEKQKMVGVPAYLKIPEGIKVYKETPGAINVKLDVLPYEVKDKNHPDKDEELDIATSGTLWYKRPFRRHVGIGPNNKSVVCPKTFGKDCPICEYRNKREEEGASNKELQKYNAKKRVLYTVIPLENDDCDEKPHLWDVSFHNFQALLNEELEVDEDRGAFPDPDNGYTLVVRFSKETFGNFSYADASRIDFEERDKSYSDEELNEVPSLDEVLKVLDYDDILAEFMGEPEDEKDEEEQEEEQKEKEETKSSNRKSRGKKEDEKQEEGKEEEQSTKRRRRKKAEKNKCPSDHTFGKDWDTQDECEDCDKWQECKEDFEETWEE